MKKVQLMFIHRITVFVSILAFGLCQITPLSISKVYAQNLPNLGAMVYLSSPYHPVMIKGITVSLDNPFQFDFIVDPGQTDLSKDQLKEESEKLIKYFLASLTLPEDEQWVNLSPYEKDRIIPQGLGSTEMGRDLLAQDYMLKQLTASLMYPEHDLGEAFWQRVYNKAQEKYGTTQIPMNTFNKIWIVPERAEVYVEGNSAFVVDSHLKVMLEEDYIALEANIGSTKHGLGDVDREDIDVISGETSAVVKEILIPEIEREVNHGETFAKLRQIYHSVILATWYKQNLKESLLGQAYVDQNKTKGIDDVEQEVHQEIYNQYVQAFKNGVYDFIKEEYDAASQQIVARKYFSGGVNIKSGKALKVSGSAQEGQAERRIKRPTIISTIVATAMVVTAAFALPKDIKAQTTEPPSRVGYSDARTLKKEQLPLTFTQGEKEAGFLKEYQEGVKARLNFFKESKITTHALNNPVLDIFVEGRARRNFREGSRRHTSQDPHVVGRLAAAAITVGNEQGVMVIPKHFLGAGSSSSLTTGNQSFFAEYKPGYHDGDTHKGLVILHDQRRIEELLIPYQYAVQAGASAIMFGHDIVPAISNRPISVSSEAVDLLRDMGFNGLVIADEILGMQALEDFYIPRTQRSAGAKVLIDMISAGVNMIISFGGRRSFHSWFGSSFQEIEKEIKDGNNQLKENIDDSVRRILSKKVEMFGRDWLVNIFERKGIEDTYNTDEQRIERYMQEMSLKGKLGQMFILGQANQDALGNPGGLVSPIFQNDSIIPPFFFHDYWVRGKEPRSYGEAYEELLASEGVSIESGNNLLSQGAKEGEETLISQEDLLASGISLPYLLERLTAFGYNYRVEGEDIEEFSLVGRQTFDRTVQRAITEFVEDQIAFGHTKEEMLAALSNVINREALKAAGLTEEYIDRRSRMFGARNEEALVKWTSYLQAAHGMSEKEIIDLFFRVKVSREDLLQAGITAQQLKQSLSALGYEPGPINDDWDIQTEYTLWLFTYIQSIRQMTAMVDLIDVLKQEKDQYANTSAPIRPSRSLPKRTQLRPSLNKRASNAPDKKGGIDLNPNLINLKTQGNELEFNWRGDNQFMPAQNIEGLYPVIINIAPAQTYPQLLKIRKEESEGIWGI